MCSSIKAVPSCAINQQSPIYSRLLLYTKERMDTMRLLHIDASILGANSASRQLSEAVVERLRKSTPDLEVTYRDLAAGPLAHLSGAHLAAA